MALRFSLVAALAGTAIVIAGTALGGGSGSTMAHAEANGWDCAPKTLILGYYHCARRASPRSRR